VAAAQSEKRESSHRSSRLAVGRSVRSDLSRNDYPSPRDAQDTRFYRVRRPDHFLHSPRARPGREHQLADRLGEEPVTGELGEIVAF